MLRNPSVLAVLAVLLLLAGCGTSGPEGYRPPNLSSDASRLTVLDSPLENDQAAQGNMPDSGRYLGFVFQAEQSAAYDIALRRLSGTDVPALIIYQHLDGGWSEPLAWASADAQEIALRGWICPATDTFLAVIDLVRGAGDSVFELRLSCISGCGDPEVCVSDADCAPGMVCWNGLCFEDEIECQADSDCRPHEACQQGFCVARCEPLAEICDGVDNDCDGTVDEGCEQKPCTSGTDCPPYLACINGVCQPICGCSTDADCPYGTICINCACVQEQCPDHDGDGFSACWYDCDDTDPNVHPQAQEVCDGVDNDCDGVVDEGCQIPCASDSDCPQGQVCLSGRCHGGGCSSDADCDDGNPCTLDQCNAQTGCQNSPVADGTLCDDGDPCTVQDICYQGSCVGSPFGQDADGDGYRSCVDCDDTNSAVHPGAVEACDGVDNDCDGVVDNGCQIQCTSDSDCLQGQVCLNGLCHGGGCASDADCDDGNPYTQDTCVNGVCEHH